LKEKILWIGLLIVFISWIGNYLYFQSKQLDQPIFLDHYYETYMQDASTLTFYYLSNKTDDAVINHVTIDGIDLYPVLDHGLVWSSSPTFEQEFTHQYLKSVTLDFAPVPFPLKETDDAWSFEEITVTFTNGQTLTTHIGEVRVFENLQNHELFNFHSGSTSSEHIHQEIMVATKPLTVEAIQIPFEELVEEVDVKVNVDTKLIKENESLRQRESTAGWQGPFGVLEWHEIKGISSHEEKLFPFQLERDNWLQLSMQMNPNHKSYVDFGVEITGTTDDGKPFMRKSTIIEHPTLTQKVLNEIIDEKTRR